VRKAIDELAAENLLIRRQGKGTFVATHAEQHVQYRFLKLVPDDGDNSSEGPAQARDHRLQATSRQRRRSHARWACAQVIPCCRCAGCCRSPDEPTILEDIWLPGGPFKGLTAERLAGDLPARCMPCSKPSLACAWCAPRRRSVRYCLIAGSTGPAGDSGDTPLLSVERVAFTYDGKAMEMRRGLYRTDKHHYRNELNERSMRASCDKPPLRKSKVHVEQDVSESGWNRILADHLHAETPPLTSTNRALPHD
jgi:GntR family transcriptional regulator